MENKKDAKLLDKLLKRREMISRKTTTLENKIFKIESYYTELANGFPITKNIEFYLKNKIEKKKPSPDDIEQRVFSTENPVVKTIEFVE